MKERNEQKSVTRTQTLVSAVLPDGELIETVYSPRAAKTTFVRGKGDEWAFYSKLQIKGQGSLVPPGAHNNLLRYGAVLLAERPSEYETEDALVAEIEAYLHRYVNLSPIFEKIAARYALLTWVHDAFNELPYLRFRGDYGSGKTRALITLGQICYKSFFASGASTTSPIFHVLDSFGGTLVLDEADFRMSDEKSDLVKILNNGNSKGIPVLRTMPTADGKEFNPRAFNVFGPKIVGSRGRFDDRALESRFITEEMGGRGLRDDIPLNLPESQKEEATALRNKLLLFRLRNRHLIFVDESLSDPSLEARFNQILIPLLSLTADIRLQLDIRDFVRRAQHEIVSERSESLEGRILELIAQHLAIQEERFCSVGELASRFVERFGGDFDRKMTPKWMGHILRKKLGFPVFRRAGVFYVSLEDREKLGVLFRRYGLAEDAATVSGDRDFRKPPSAGDQKQT